MLVASPVVGPGVTLPVLPSDVSTSFAVDVANVDHRVDVDHRVGPLDDGNGESEEVGSTPVLDLVSDSFEVLCLVLKHDGCDVFGVGALDSFKD
jgi:hypothetical protein